MKLLILVLLIILAGCSSVPKKCKYLNGEAKDQCMARHYEDLTRLYEGKGGKGLN